ncbi:ABC1-domain-containing protein [Gloeophyllum trabeum ATCC 11539]|uniref:ABC1-domain-containing protein n=1 Tax=Gloeophyllum trabeum (strain ATCC 11539 / FP-39264 / Madison 617) TaxID=670483 RepID=S7QE09_GLOTA|nr:ABC1-domain-containing protein [Gloeophyllum trabeum ATCC 11539]EPQ57523.1 ABC1-domain-containing protein [Gloeophyllum trabeum ATCC 11539]
MGMDERRNTAALAPSESSTLVNQTLHKKSASDASSRSILRSSLDFKRIKEEDNSAAKRISIEGQQKLQEDFNRLQLQRQQEAEKQKAEEAIDWDNEDFWGEVVSDYQRFASEHPDQLAAAIEKGIPSTLRGMVWQLMSASKDPGLEETYLKLLKESSPHEKAISRDLGRTFPHHEFFTDGQGIGQENLFNVLKAYSLYDPQVGYCQGLPFVVAILLLNVGMPDEEAFCLLVRLMYSYDLRGHFLPEMPKLQLRLVRPGSDGVVDRSKVDLFICSSRHAETMGDIVQFDRLIEEMLPVLHVHFLRQGIKSSMFCSQWFLTLFSYRFPLDIVFRIFDNCLASGIESIFGFSLCLLAKNEERLLSLKFDEILAFLNNKVFERYQVHDDASSPEREAKKIPKYRADEFVQDAVSLKITPFMLDAYAHEYEDMCRARDAHALELDALRNSNRNLSAQVKTLESSLAQLNTEHVEVLNQLVMARLKNEEIEGELVRYKLLCGSSLIGYTMAHLSESVSATFSADWHQNIDCSSANLPARPQNKRRQFSSSEASHAKGSSRSYDRSVARKHPWVLYAALGLGGVGAVAYQTNKPFRHSVLAVVRCSRVAYAAIRGIIDYKWTFASNYTSEEAKRDAYSKCHRRSAHRVLRALLANGGIFIKLGQHMSSLVVLPVEWTGTMRPLQDQCEPTPYDDLEKLFLSDMGQTIEDIFDEFDPKPIGVASLAQVHVGRDKESGRRVAVKLQHPHLAEFCDVDMNMVEVALGWIKSWFPEFEFTWLGEEMRENLPKEMDFTIEAKNAARVEKDFEDIRTSLYIPKVMTAKKRVLIMEYIQGGRVDDLTYLADNNIDRNKVSLELARIFAQMVHINGWFHAVRGLAYTWVPHAEVLQDPHPGNLLIRPAPLSSKSPYNFEIVLLDHGLYFDLDTALRINYSKFWLSLIKSASPETIAERRQYAQLFGNIGPDLYPVFEAAITGRATLKGQDERDAGKEQNAFKRASSMLDISPPSEEEMDAIREAVINNEGILLSVFDVLRRVPRRVLMVLKLNDLTRNLDHALMTTHSNIRVFLIMAKYCARAVWQDDRTRLVDEMRERGLVSIGLLWEYFACWWRYEKLRTSFAVVEWAMDWKAQLIKITAWLRGLRSRGLEGAYRAAAGLA